MTLSKHPVGPTAVLLCYAAFCWLLPASADEVVAPELVPPVADPSPALSEAEQSEEKVTPGIQLGGISDMLQLLREESVQKELQLEPGQESKIKGLETPLAGVLGAGLLDRLPELGVGQPEGPEQGEAAAAPPKDFDIQQVQDVIGSLLQEEQFKRLKEIVLQLRMRRQGAPSTLSTNELARALDLTREQQDELRMRGEQAAEVTREQMLAKMSDLRATVQDVLTPEQSDKLDVLLGSEFDLPAAMLKPTQPAGLLGRERPEGGRLLNRRRGGLFRGRADEAAAEPAPAQD